MAPTLDLTHSTHAKMMVSSPRMNLRRGASYQNEKAPLSATSARFNFDHLLFSPPPSPGLPALVPRPRKSPARPRPSRVVRLASSILGLVFFLYIAGSLIRRRHEIPIVGWSLQEEEYEMVGQYDLPDFPTPIAVTDVHGRSKWTVSIPPTSNFPLTVQEYSDICAKCREVAAHVREMRGQAQPSLDAQSDYYYEDPYFVDVNEAEKRGLLPGAGGSAKKIMPRDKEGHLLGLGEAGDSAADETICKTSLTFVLESTDAGLGTSLMMLWMAYGLAQKEKRAFFIDDSRWAYGQFTEIFKAPPNPGCKQPPHHEMLPCPHNARHLVVSMATARDTFGDKFAREFEDTASVDAGRERPMFDMARRGYEALFHLSPDDDSYVKRRVEDLRTKAKVPGGPTDGAVVGVHVRHGDQHPFEYQYSKAYLPLNLYTDKVSEILDNFYNHTARDGGEDETAKHHSLLVVASDDPQVYEAEEFSKYPRAQDMIQLANSPPAPTSNHDRSFMHKFVDDTFGWEGGFFANMFWNLGRSATNQAAKDGRVLSPNMTPETVRLRNLMGRAYTMELAVLGEGSDAVVCTVSAMGCRLIAIMMGWEKAMQKERWVNIDGEYPWMSISL